MARAQRIVWFLALALLAGCTPAASVPLASPTPAAPTVAASAQPSPTARPSASPAAPVASPSFTLTPEPSAYTPLCSPLEGESLAQLASPDLLKNPFDPPRLGDDGGHFGVDFAYWTAPDGSPMTGLPIHASLDGVVAGTIDDRFPYGNAILIETPLQAIDPAWRARLPFAEYAFDAPLTPPISLTCPDYDYTPPSRTLSLYTLYAHMNAPTDRAMGDAVACGEPIGAVGTTGKSVNAHLHFETRIGPSGSTFASMNHYDAAATEDEMRTYCLWRLSGAYRPFDPMQLLSIR